MKEQLLHQTENHIRHFFHVAKLDRKKWYKDLKTFDELLYAFFVIRKRMIQPKNYQIHESNKLQHSTLKPEVLRDYQSLKNALSTKGDLKKFHTENSKILSPVDGLLEEWNINHLHIDRSRYQVFFLVEEKDIFIINICKHFERNRTSYSKNSLLGIIEENWPEKCKKQEFKKLNNISEIYKSQYGWQKLEQFYDWVDSIVLVIKNELTEAEINFVDNEAFVACEAKSKILIPGTISFEV